MNEKKTGFRGDWVISLISGFLASLKDPWAFMVVSTTIAFTCFILLEDRAFGVITAFKFASVIVGVLGTTMVLAAAIGAYRVMLAMLWGMMLIATIAALSLDAEAFKDAAFEGMMLMIAGSIGILIKQLLERHMRNSKE